jgi:hypothetical protein
MIDGFIGRTLVFRRDFPRRRGGVKGGGGKTALARLNLGSARRADPTLGEQGMGA